MKKILSISLLTLLLFCIQTSEAGEYGIFAKNHWILEALPPAEGLGGNGISDLAIQTFVDSTILWAGTGAGLSRLNVAEDKWYTYSRQHGIGKGSISALTINGDEIWVATTFDSVFTVGSTYTGGGISYSLDRGQNWNYIKQPGDTPAQNVTWDIAILENTIWITSWGGGLRKSTDLGQSWTLVTPDSFTFNPAEINNHNSWSVINADGVLWVGTAGGINKSLDNGKTWVNFTHQNQEQPISGNWVRQIGYQTYDDKNVIWAACWIASTEEEDPTEFYALARSEDQGYTWDNFLEGERVYNFAFHGPDVYAATENGLFKSSDGGATWAHFPMIRDLELDQAIYTTDFYAAAVTPSGKLFVGTNDGLARSDDNGLTWQLYRADVHTGVNGEPRTYAFPNPFSPMRFNVMNGDGHVRLQYNTTAATTVTIKIYDFALDLVKTVVENKPRPTGDFHEVWDGKNERLEQVANGVYHYSVEIANDGTYWGKIMVVD